MTSIITWNVNGIRAVHKKGLFLDWLQEEAPDVLCLQETKAKQEQLEKELLEPCGYTSYFHSAERPGYSGVASYCKKEPLSVENFGIEDFDKEGRVQVLRFKDFYLINAYFPNSQEGGARLDYKVAFCDAMLAFCKDLEKQNKNLVLCGDYNIAHKAIDLKNPETNTKSPGFLPEERAWMDQFIEESGFVDTFRMFCDEPEHYTWWSYRTAARKRNAGWRIDYHCVNQAYRDKVLSCEILNQVFGSDHCPVKVKIQGSLQYALKKHVLPHCRNAWLCAF